MQSAGAAWAGAQPAGKHRWCFSASVAAPPALSAFPGPGAATPVTAGRQAARRYPNRRTPHERSFPNRAAMPERAPRLVSGRLTVFDRDFQAGGTCASAWRCGARLGQGTRADPGRVTPSGWRARLCPEGTADRRPLVCRSEIAAAFQFWLRPFALARDRDDIWHVRSGNPAMLQRGAQQRRSQAALPARGLSDPQPVSTPDGLGS